MVISGATSGPERSAEARSCRDGTLAMSRVTVAPGSTGSSASRTARTS